MENEKDIFELSSEFEGDIITSNEDFDFAFREGLPYWMVAKYYRHAEAMAALDPCPMPDIERIGYWGDEK